MVGLLSSVGVDDRLDIRSSYPNRRPPLIILNYPKLEKNGQEVKVCRRYMQ
jgi:hypothetical protein